MKRPIVIHPFLFSISPIIYLVAHNIDQLLLIDRFSISSIFMPMVISILLASLDLLLLSIIFRNVRKAGLLVSVGLLIFFSYGHLYNIVSRLMGASAFWIGDFVIGPHKAVFFACFILFCVAVCFCIISRRDLYATTSFLNIVAGCLVAVSIINIAAHEFNRSEIWGRFRDKKEGLTHKIDAGDLDQQMPDIYYIILDGYTSSKVLREIYGYDNDEFTDYLERKGFYIAYDSWSNYAQTTHSLASSLNMEYINYVKDIVDSKYSAQGIIYLMLRNNKIVDFLKKIGYKYVHFATAYGSTAHNKFADMEFHLGKGNEFYMMLIKTTMLNYFEEKLIINDARKRTLDTFSILSKMHTVAGPKFVFAHLIIPHPPFYFDEYGNLPDTTKGGATTNEWADKDKYVSQVAFVNKKVIEFVDEILSRSSEPPVIIFQGDHGSAATFGLDANGWENPTREMIEERLSILNAYYLPGGGDTILYSSISPVNTFRVIFNYYFSTDYELLKDIGYFSSYEDSFEFITAEH